MYRFSFSRKSHRGPWSLEHQTQKHNIGNIFYYNYILLQTYIFIITKSLSIKLK